MPVREKPALTPAERRARREARRAAQRVANVGRAAKMHEARLAWERAPELRPAGDEAAIGACHIGCSGWYYWHWQGGFYRPIWRAPLGFDFTRSSLIRWS